MRKRHVLLVVILALVVIALFWQGYRPLYEFLCWKDGTQTLSDGWKWEFMVNRFTGKREGEAVLRWQDGSVKERDATLAARRPVCGNNGTSTIALRVFLPQTPDEGFGWTISSIQTAAGSKCKTGQMAAQESKRELSIPRSATTTRLSVKRPRGLARKNCGGQSRRSDAYRTIAQRHA